MSNATPETTAGQLAQNLKERRGVVFAIGLVLGVALTFVYFTFAAPLFTGKAADLNPTNQQTLGQVALTESELINLVRKEGVVAYWSGPQKNCLYSLEINANKQVFVRYLPDGKGATDTAPNYQVIGTYPQADAFNVTKAAGSQANSISFVNADGAQVYYSKALAKNVYLAYPNVAYEIEIYNPVDGASLSIATASGQILRIQ